MFGLSSNLVFAPALACTRLPSCRGPTSPPKLQRDGGWGWGVLYICLQRHSWPSDPVVSHHYQPRARGHTGNRDGVQHPAAFTFHLQPPTFAP